MLILGEVRVRYSLFTNISVMLSHFPHRKIHPKMCEFIAIHVLIIQIALTIHIKLLFIKEKIYPTKLSLG